jgi:hypothetical protein
MAPVVRRHWYGRNFSCNRPRVHSYTSMLPCFTLLWIFSHRSEQLQRRAVTTKTTRIQQVAICWSKGSNLKKRAYVGDPSRSEHFTENQCLEDVKLRIRLKFSQVCTFWWSNLNWKSSFIFVHGNWSCQEPPKWRWYLIPEGINSHVFSKENLKS